MFFRQGAQLLSPWKIAETIDVFARLPCSIHACLFFEIAQGVRYLARMSETGINHLMCRGEFFAGQRQIGLIKFHDEDPFLVVQPEMNTDNCNTILRNNGTGETAHTACSETAPCIKAMPSVAMTHHISLFHGRR